MVQHIIFSIPADFYRQNWPFLLLDTQLNVTLGKQTEAGMPDFDNIFILEDKTY